MYQRLVIIFISIFSTSAFSFNSKLVFTEPCTACSTIQNKEKLSVSKEFKTQKNGLVKITKIILNTKSYEIEFPETMGADSILPLYSLDLDGDGFLDLAYNHRSGIQNKYYYYFLFNPKSKSYEPLGEFPELEMSNKELISIEHNGPVRTITKKYQFKNRKLVLK